MTLLDGWRESLSEIAKQTGLTRRYVYRVMRELEAEGVLEIERRQEPGSGWVPNLIRVRGLPDPRDISTETLGTFEPDPRDMARDTLGTPIYEGYEGRRVYNEPPNEHPAPESDPEPRPPGPRPGGAPRPSSSEAEAPPSESHREGDDAGPSGLLAAWAEEREARTRRERVKAVLEAKPAEDWGETLAKLEGMRPFGTDAKVKPIRPDVDVGDNGEAAWGGRGRP